MFDERVIENPDKVIAVCNEEDITYLELYNEVNMCASELMKYNMLNPYHQLLTVYNYS